MLRGDGLVGPDGIRDVDLLVPRAAAAWIEERFGARRDELLGLAAAARGASPPAPAGGAAADAGVAPAADVEPGPAGGA